jgi:AraC-like DNA-binding protein
MVAGSTLKSWSNFLAAQLRAVPLRYVHGMRHSVTARFHCQTHDHPMVEIVYHPSGSGISRLGDGTEIAFGEGSAVIYAARMPHDQVMDSDGEDLCVQIALPGRAGRLPRGYLFLPLVDDSVLLEEIYLLSKGQVKATAAEQGILDLRATALLLELIHLACRGDENSQQDAAERYVDWAERYMRQNFARITALPEIAAQVGISQDYLRHLFQQAKGRSPVVYLNEIRVDRAKNLLMYSSLPLKQIAGMCGFRNEYYFSAVFKKYARQAPLAYRRKTRGRKGGEEDNHLNFP